MQLGVIIFIHPGIHSDFSPRFETMLINLANSGYLIICPNYPMSAGFGKIYGRKNLKAAVNDIVLWKRTCQNEYDLPIYLMAASDGNVLMEEAISSDPTGIEASVSLFGLFSNDDRISMQIPTLYILGENDEQVNFPYRLNTLLSAKKANGKISILTFSDEGHWLRKTRNLRTTHNSIIKHLNID